MPSPLRYDNPSLYATNAVGDVTPDQRRLITSAYSEARSRVLVACLIAGVCLVGIIVVFPALAALFGALFGIQATTLPIHLQNGMAFSVPCSGTLLLVIAAIIAFFAARSRIAAALHGLRTFTEARGALADIDQRRIASGDGQIVWRSGEYHAQLSAYGVTGAESDLKGVPGATPALPPPGAYQVLYLPSARMLLSARPLAQSASAATAAIRGESAEARTLQATLAQALAITSDDLAANRNGTLSPAQVARLRRRAAKENWIVFALVAAVALGEIVYFKRTPNPDIESALVVLAIGVGLFAFAVYSRGQLLRDVAEARVTVFEGNVTPHIISGDDGAAPYWYDLPGQSNRLQVTQDAYNALVKGLPYRLYYLRRSETVLTIEPLPGSSSPPNAPPPNWQNS